MNEMQRRVVRGSPNNKENRSKNQGIIDIVGPHECL